MLAALLAAFPAWAESPAGPETHAEAPAVCAEAPAAPERAKAEAPAVCAESPAGRERDIAEAPACAESTAAPLRDKADLSAEMGDAPASLRRPRESSGARKGREAAPQVKLYGFVRTYCAFDTRESVAGTEDFFYYMPKDENITASGDDLNGQMSMRFAALTSRLGVNVSGYESGGLKMGAKIEADFYSGLSGVTGTATMRMRQAYATIAGEGWGILAGQAWHPMADDKADVFSLNSGAPFGPFSRTPQFKLDVHLAGPVSLTAAALWQMQYTSAGPAGPSANYIKYGCTPEIYAGVNFASNGLLLRLGVDLLSIRPRTNDGSVKVSDRITTVSPYAYAQLRSGLFCFKAKTIMAQAGEHFNLNGGYGISGIKSDGVSYEYTPTQNASSWVSLTYGKRTQWILFGGYVRNFGTRDVLLGSRDGYAPAANLYFGKNSFSNMNRMWRVTPSVVRNIGKLSLGIEYEITSVQYGSYKTVDGVKMIGCYGLAQNNLHWITNHRIQALVKFSF